MAIENTTDIPFKTIEKNWLMHGREERGDFVVKDNTTLANLYSEMYPPCPMPEGKPNPPQIDFKKDMIIAVFQGACSSGGYDIEIKSLTQTTEGLEVLVLETEARKDRPQTMSQTYPAHIIQTPRYDGNVSFKRV